MTTAPFTRPPAKTAPEELLVLAKWEEFTTWLLDRSAKWPKCARFTITQRLENHALDVTESLVVARYQKLGRRSRLDDVNLVLERMRFLHQTLHFLCAKVLKCNAMPHARDSRSAEKVTGYGTGDGRARQERANPQGAAQDLR